MDFSRMDGITFIDTVIVVDSCWPPTDSLMFHELVHVAQYRLLGVHEFARRYVYGWAENGFVYEAIPLEAQAFELQGRFDAHASAPFCVENEIRRSLGL
jgi:hypothetical protein